MTPPATNPQPAAAGEVAAEVASPSPSPSPGDDPAEPGGRAGGPDAVVELIGVRKTYYKPDGTVMVEALRGIDLAIGRGEYSAIMGASGSGKSTLLNLLGCLDQPTAGEYLLDGEAAAKMSDERLSQLRGRKIGFVFQAFNLIPQLTIEENVAVPLFYQRVPRGERLERAKTSLSRVGLGDRLGHRPRELSGGQQQRVAIARALVTEPAILMADEPTGNLDSTTGRAILGLFDELHAGGLTIIMVTHDDGIADRCERVVRLRDGVIESDRRLRTLAKRGTPEAEPPADQPPTEKAADGEIAMAAEV